MAPNKTLFSKKNASKSPKGYPLPASCSVSSLNEFVTDGNASFLRAARSGNLEKVIEFLKGNVDINTSNANGLNALHLAAKEGHVNVVTELLKRGANVNAATKKGNTALHIASLAGQEEVVRVLIQLGANVNVQSQNGFTPLYMAAQENHDSVVSFLLANGANQSLATEDGFTPLAVALQQGHDKVVAVLLENDTKGRVRLPALHIAAKKDDCKAATLLLQSDHNPDVTSKSGFTPLHIAAHYGNENIAKILLSKGADVNYAAKHQITPLHVASKWGKINMVTLLLEKGANIEAATRDGLTPLHCAARSGHDQVVDLLLEKGAPFLAKTKNGLAPLHMASQGDHVDSARILLYHKAPVDDVTVDYLTALHVAAHCGHVKVAKLLLDRKADPNARALNGFTPLHIACKKNRIKVVELLLKHGASIEATTESGLTPLHVASFMGCMNIVIYLIQNGANPDVPTVRGETPLHLAARANQTDIIRILLRNGASVDARAREEQTPLHIAARLGNVDIVSLLLQHGAAVDAVTKDMYTALHIAAKEDQEEVASALLDHGASLTSTTKKGFTPLHLAAKYGNIKVARLLLQKSAPVDAQGKNGVTPLHVAAHYDHVNVALLLLDKGASPHAMAKNGYTPLHIAAKKNQMDIASTLLEYGANTNSESKAGFTPLHLSSQEGHADLSSLLIEHKANVNHKANNGLTPLHLCAQDDRVNVATILVKNGAEIGPQTKAGYTPLHVASHFGQINMVRYLLQNEADVHLTTSHGYTPLHQAAQQGHTLVVNLLLENEASPNVTTSQGQTPLSIAQRLGYISVVETLKVVTETTVTTTTTTVTEEKYKVVAPETMQETFMTDSEDEGGADFDEAAIFGKPTHATHVYLPYVEGQNFQMSEEAMLGDQSYRYLTADEMKSLGDDSLPIDVTKDEKHHDVMQSVKQFGAPMVEEDKLSPQHGTPVESGFSEKFSPDNIDLARAPVHAGFLVSFMVDARGGAMRGCRHSGVRVIIPPRKASMPMRITCRYLRKEKLIHPPPLMEGEACASRILEMGPVGARFLGPVIIEVPHFASTRGKEREITILRSDTGESWREHTLEASEEAVQEVLNESFEGEELSALEDLNTNRITRILTTDFPQYFAIVTRVRQEVHGVGPEGGMVSSTVVPQVQAIFPEGALTKKIRVGLQAQPIAPELVAKLLGNRVAVSPIVTVEPRRRKFHKPITLTIPVPQAATKGMINQYSGDAPTLRLLCSITGSTKSGGSSKAQWEDVTGSTPLTFVNDCVSFTTTVSARFWLMDCRQVNEVTRFATELYQEAVYVPFMSKFVIFAKRHDPYEAQLRVFCMTDDKEDKTLESQEHFTEIAKSRDVEVLEGKMQYLEFAGNLVPVTKSGEQLKLTFQAFHENRLPFTVRVKDPHVETMGRIAFMKEPKAARGEPPQVPICNLNVALPEITVSESTADVLELVTLEKRYDFIQEAGLSKPELIHRADLRLSDIARELDKDWISLAQQLDLPESDVEQIKLNSACEQSEQALMMLRLWLQKSGPKATGNELEKGLRKINREDIIKNCMFNVELVTDDVEKAVAKVHLDQSGFDVFKEELGSSREASMRRGASLDISYDEQDIMKEAESAAETSSETGSLFERDQISQALTDDKDVYQPGESVRNTDDDNHVSSIAPVSKNNQISSEQCESSEYHSNSDVGIHSLNCLSNNMQQIKVLDSNVKNKVQENGNDCPYKSEYKYQSELNGHEDDNFQNSRKLHEFWPPDKISGGQSNFMSKNLVEVILASPESSEDNASPNLFSKNISDCNQEQISPHLNLCSDNNIFLENQLCGLTKDNVTQEMVKDFDAVNHENCVRDSLATNATKHLNEDKPTEISDLGYCSMDKDPNASETSVNHEIKYDLQPVLVDSLPCQEAQMYTVPSMLENVKENQISLSLNSELHSGMNTHQDISQKIINSAVQKSDLYENASPENYPSPNNLCFTSAKSYEGITEPKYTVTNSEVDKSEQVRVEGNNCSQNAKIRRASKTPPPSPVDEAVNKGDESIEKLKEIPFESMILPELKGVTLRQNQEVEIKTVGISGGDAQIPSCAQELIAKLTESETWPSGDLDTSQVSVSSLPDDEKSEPTTATLSGAAGITTDLEKKSPAEDIEKTEIDGDGSTTHIIQKTTHLTLTMPKKSDDLSDNEEYPDMQELIGMVEKPDEIEKQVITTTVTREVREVFEGDLDALPEEFKKQSITFVEQRGGEMQELIGDSSKKAEDTIVKVLETSVKSEDLDLNEVQKLFEKDEKLEAAVALVSELVPEVPQGSDDVITKVSAFVADTVLPGDSGKKLEQEDIPESQMDIKYQQSEHEVDLGDAKDATKELSADADQLQFVVHESYDQAVVETEVDVPPCAFVNTAFAGAELIDEVEQSGSIRARSPYEVIRDDHPEGTEFASEQLFDAMQPKDSSDKLSKVTYVTKHVEVRRRPLLQHIPSEISEEDLVEREMSPEIKQSFEIEQIEVPDLPQSEAESRSSLKIIETVTKKIVSIEEKCSDTLTTEDKKDERAGERIEKISGKVMSSEDGLGSDIVTERKIAPQEIKLKGDASESFKTDDVTSPESDTGIPTSPFELISESELSDGEHKSPTYPSSLTLPKSDADDKSQDSVIITTHSQSITEKTISASMPSSKTETSTLNGKDQTDDHAFLAHGSAILTTETSNDAFENHNFQQKTQQLEEHHLINGPGEVEYQAEYDYEAEYCQTVDPEGRLTYESASYIERPFMEEDNKKSRYSSISDDVIDSEIGEILNSDQQLEDIIERPVTPEPPKDDVLDISCLSRAELSSDLEAVVDRGYDLPDERGRIPLSPLPSPSDPKAGFAYGMQFEKDILEPPEEAMDIDSDQYSEEKEPPYNYGMRFERDPDLEEEEIPCYGDLYTHEEEDEDAAENGEKIKPVVKPSKDPEFDILAGRKYFSKNVELDDLSMSSLQEFERLEAEIVSGRKSSIGSVDSFNGKLAVSKSGEHDDVSMSSLTEFERIERECSEVEKIDPSMQESITQLSEIEEGHESQASEASQENKSDVGKEEDLSIVEEYDNELDNIDEIILKAQNKVSEELPFQYLIKQTQNIDTKTEVSDQGNTAYEDPAKTEHFKTVITTEVHKVIIERPPKFREDSFGRESKEEDIDQDSLRDELSLKPDSLTEDTKQDFQDSLRDEKFEDIDSLQGDIPDEMRDSLLEERHIEDDSLREMDILPDESSLSLESSFPIVAPHEVTKEVEMKGIKCETDTIGKAFESVMTADKAEIILADPAKGDIMLSSTDSLEQSSSYAQAAFLLESESGMSSSLNSAITSEDYTMVSSTDTLEHEGRFTYRYEDIPVDDIEMLIKEGHRVIVDSEGNIQTQYDVKHFVEGEDNINSALSLSTKGMHEIDPSLTNTVHVHSAVTTVRYVDGDKQSQFSKIYPVSEPEETGDTTYESTQYDPNVEVEEITTTDEFGNPKVIRKIKRTVQTKTQYSSSSSSADVEEKLKEFLREHAAGENAGVGKEEVKEERITDEKGNVVLIRTVQQQMLTDPEVHSRTFVGPDADTRSQEYVETFRQLEPTDDTCEFEKIDEQGNVVRVTQQLVIKPEVHTVSFTGPDAHQQMEEYMKQWASSQRADDSGAEQQIFTTVQTSRSGEGSQQSTSTEHFVHEASIGGSMQTSLPPQSSDQVVMHTTTTTSTYVTSFDSQADKPSDSTEQTSSSAIE